MQPFDLEGIGRVEHDAGAVQRGLHPPEQFAGTLAITRAKARAAWLRYVICHLGRIVVVAGFGHSAKWRSAASALPRCSSTWPM
jgi:hypothetical protein